MFSSFDEPFARYHRQMLLEWIGDTGQARLAASRVLLVGCGALGTHLAEWLARAGVGYIRIVDRDVVDASNLQRQVLYQESDADKVLAKAQAAQHHIHMINSDIMVDAHVGELNPSTVINFSKDCDLIMDGADNYETRLLMNDVAVKLGIPYIYAGVTGMEATMAVILPRTLDQDSPWEHARMSGPCLRCLLPDAPAPGVMPTCDTAGVLGPAVGVIAGMQAIEAMKILTGRWSLVSRDLHRMDFITMKQQTIRLDEARDEECPCCAHRQFEYLEREEGSMMTVLCGRDAYQLQPAHPEEIDFLKLSHQMSNAGRVEADKFRLRFLPSEYGEDVIMTVFKDGRVLIQGANSSVQAKAMYDRYVGG